MSKLIAVSALVLSFLALPASGLAAPPEGSGLPLVFSPPALSFEKTTVGNQSPSKEVDLFNEGEEEAAIDKIAIEGEDAAAFNLNNNGCGALFQFNHCGLWISFTANSPGEKHATAVVTFKNGRPAESFAISGVAVEPQLTISPFGYDFGLQRVYDNRNAYFQVTNSGEAAVQVNNLEIIGGSNSFWANGNNSNCWGWSLQPGDSCNVEVTFSPQDAVAYSAQLRVSANGYGFTADLNGAGGRAVIEASPNPAEFGTTAVGGKGAVRTIVLTNTGNIPAGFFIGIVAGGDSGSFQLLSENCSGMPLQPSDSCSATVRFTPLGAGPKAARLAFFGDSDNGAQIMLSGEGVSPLATLLPAGLDFGEQTVGGKSESQAFAVSNDGATPLELGAVTLVGQDPDQFAVAGDECTDTTLAPGEECLVRARFIPDSAGEKAARLRIGRGGGVLSAALSGFAVAADDSNAAEFAAAGSALGRHWQHRHRHFSRGNDVTSRRARRARCHRFLPCGRVVDAKALTAAR
jgi:trimeric autotransporter adhesin